MNDLAPTPPTEEPGGEINLAALRNLAARVRSDNCEANSDRSSWNLAIATQDLLAAYERVVAERDAVKAYRDDLSEMLAYEAKQVARLRSDLNQATAVVEAAEAWRDQFAEPDAVKWPRRSGLIAAVDAYRACRAAPTGGVEG